MRSVGSLGLEGKVVVVVGGGGANNGIGRATAILFAKLGSKIAVLDINSEAAAETARLINGVSRECRLGMASRCIEYGSG